MNTTTGQRILTILERYELQSSGEGQYSCNSPLRAHSNSHGFRIRIEPDGEHGAWYDNVSGEKGSLYDLAARLGIPVVDTMTPEATLRPYRDLGDYASAHGIGADVLRKAGWGEKITYQNRPALPFKTATGTRYRFIDGDKPKYKSEMGYQACWYGLKSALVMAKARSLPLVVCNGEISTVVAQFFGIPACCVTAGEKTLNSALFGALQAVLENTHVLIVLDCDDTGRKAAAGIAAQLGAQGTVIDLGLSEGGDLADWCVLHRDDALKALLHRQSLTPAQATPAKIEASSDLQSVWQAAHLLSTTLRQDARVRREQDVQLACATLRAELEKVESLHAAPTLASVTELGDENLKQLEWALEHKNPVQGLRSNIPKLDLAIGGWLPEIYDLYGATSMGKSWLAVTLCNAFRTQGAGLVVPTESVPGRWLTRLVANITGVAADRIETGMLSDAEVKKVKDAYAGLRGLNCHVLKNGRPTAAQVRAAVLAGLEKFDYKWVIVDSATNMSHPGATAIYDITRGVFDGLQALYQETNLPIILTTQVGRDVSERTNKMPQLGDGYGGGVIEFNAGTVLALYRHGYYVEKGMAEADPRFPDNMTLVRILKNRWRPSSGIHSVRLTFVGSSGFYEEQPNGAN